MARASPHVPLVTGFCLGTSASLSSVGETQVRLPPVNIVLHPKELKK